MPEANHIRTRQALEAADRCGVEYWNLKEYDRGTDQLLVRSLWPIETPARASREGFWGSLKRRLSATKDYAYLAFRSPGYVRLGPPFGSPVLATGARLESIRASLPASLSLGDRQVVVSDSHGVEWCVVCESVGFYRSGWRDGWITRSRQETEVLPPFTGTRHHEFSRSSLMLASQSPYLGEIEGATLAWWGHPFATTLDLILMVTGLPGEPKAVRFTKVHYVDCPTTMHGARLRLATGEEDEALCRRLDQPREAIDTRHVVIEYDQGTATILADYLWLSWRDTGQGWWVLSQSDRVPDPSWRVAPPPGDARG